MMKRTLTVILLCTLLLAVAPARADIQRNSYAYVNNPIITDRLHLREKPDEGSRSLGKYYNGTPVYVLEKTNSKWVKVRIGNENVGYSGYMMRKYLTESTDAEFINAMPLFVSSMNIWTVYQEPDLSALQSSLGKYQHVYLMGFTNDWCHIAVPTGGSEGDLYYFVPAGDKALTLGTHAYISNPVKTDRLHLRVKPDKSAKSLGKYYNGAEADVLGQTMDRQWCYVEMYGRKGWMKSAYLTFEGDKPNSTYYGVVTCSAAAKTALRSTPSAKGKIIATLDASANVEVFGVLEDWLHVRVNGIMCFIPKSSTDFTD